MADDGQSTPTRPINEANDSKFYCRDVVHVCNPLNVIVEVACYLESKNNILSQSFGKDSQNEFSEGNLRDTVNIKTTPKLGLDIEEERKRIQRLVEDIRKKLEWSKKYDNFIEEPFCYVSLHRIIAKQEIIDFDVFGFSITEEQETPKQTEVFFDSQIKYLIPPKNYRESLKPYVTTERQFFAVITECKAVRRKKDDVLVLLPQVRKSGSHSGRSFNPYMSYRSALSSSARVFGALKYISKEYGVDNLYVSALTFTFPKEYSLGNNHLTGWTQTWELWTEFRFILEKYLNPSGKGVLGYSVNLHIWASEEPLEPHMHFHMILVNGWANRIIGSSPGKPEYEIIRANPVLDKDELRQLWTDFLHSKGIGLDHNLIDVHHWAWNMDTHSSKILHYIKYCRRAWVYDFAKFCFKYPGYVPNEAYRERIDRFVYYSNRTRVYGFWKYLTALVPETDIYDPIEAEDVEKTDITLRGLPEDEVLAVYCAEGSKVKFLGKTTAGELQDHILKLHTILINYFGDGG